MLTFDAYGWGITYDCNARRWIVVAGGCYWTRSAAEYAAARLNSRY
jgi:hypothetical protein